MKHCLDCGTLLEEKFLEKEGMIPYCGHCKAFRFPTFNVAVSMIVLNETEDKILLLRQKTMVGYNLVAGFVNKGEAAEHAVTRELQEEVGIELLDYRFNKSEYYEASNTLMLNFICKANSESLVCDEDEVDYAQWFSIEDTRATIEQGSLAHKFLEYFIAHPFTF